jgi:hypothetical protein
MKYTKPLFCVVLCGFETWPFTSREEQRLWVGENSVLRRMFGPKWNEMTGGWRKSYD